VVIHDYPVDELDSMILLLRELAFRIVTASTGEEGLKIASTDRPELIISDMTLSDMSAVELCRRIREYPQLSNVPILMVSGLRRDSEPVVEAIAAGASDYLRMPYSPMTFLLKIVKLTSRRLLEANPEAAPVVATLPQPGGAPDIPRGTETLLLVEDDEMLRNLTRELLELFGYKVLPASGGREALVVAEQYPRTIHVLVTDVSMPEMSGRTLAEELMKARPGVRILYMTGDSPDVIAHHGLVHEGARVVQKPFSAKTLAQILRDMLKPPTVQ
jgi:CheY-like chemotaxis protein